MKVRGSGVSSALPKTESSSSPPQTVPMSSAYILYRGMKNPPQPIIYYDFEGEKEKEKRAIAYGISLFDMMDRGKRLPGLLRSPSKTYINKQYKAESKTKISNKNNSKPENAKPENSKPKTETEVKDLKNARKQGVRRMWADEAKKIEEGKPSRKWSAKQEKNILDKKVPRSEVDEKPVEGSHIRSVKEYPKEAANSKNIVPKSFTEHRAKDGGEHSSNPKDYVTDETTTP